MSRINSGGDTVYLRDLKVLHFSLSRIASHLDGGNFDDSVFDNMISSCGSFKGNFNASSALPLESMKMIGNIVLAMRTVVSSRGGETYKIRRVWFDLLEIIENVERRADECEEIAKGAVQYARHLATDHTITQELGAIEELLDPHSHHRTRKNLAHSWGLGVVYERKVTPRETDGPRTHLAYLRERLLRDARNDGFAENKACECLLAGAGAYLWEDTIFCDKLKQVCDCVNDDLHSLAGTANALPRKVVFSITCEYAATGVIDGVSVALQPFQEKCRSLTKVIDVNGEAFAMFTEHVHPDVIELVDRSKLWRANAAALLDRAKANPADSALVKQAVAIDGSFLGCVSPSPAPLAFLVCSLPLAEPLLAHRLADLRQSVSVLTQISSCLRVGTVGLPLRTPVVLVRTVQPSFCSLFQTTMRR